MKSPAIRLPISFTRLLLVAPWPLTVAITAASASAALSMASYWLIFRIFSLLFSIPAFAGYVMPEVWTLASLTLVLLTLRWALMAASHAMAHVGAFAIQHQLRLAMARRLGDVPMSFFSGRGSGSLRRTLTDDVNSLEGFFAHMLPDATSAAVTPLAALTLLFLADWPLALATLLPLPLVILVQWWLMHRGTGHLRQWKTLQKRISNQVSEYVRGVAVVKSFGMDARSFGKLAHSISSAVDWVSGYARINVGGWALFVSLLTTNFAVIVPLGAYLYTHGKLDMSTWLLFLLIAPAVLAPLLRLTSVLGEHEQRAEAMARINEILTEPPLTGAGATHPPGTRLGITFEGLYHRYSERVTLEAISFTAAAGKVTALVGPSGSGKSTLLHLVARMYEFESGNLRIGGIDIRRWPLDPLLSRISIVFQEVFLFHGSVRDNLRLARPESTDAEIEAAARAAQAHEFISLLPQGYDTPLGERGSRLSGGERQRISIARALLKDAPILLLDEATSSIDAESEALILHALALLCRGRTVLMVGHRLHNTKHADHIVVMDGGRVADQGTHQQLLSSCSIYRHLWMDHEQAHQWSLRSSSGSTGHDA